MKACIYTLIAIFVLSLAVFGQKPDEWKNLKINEASPEKAIETLGKPKTDKKDDLLIYNPKWVSKKTRQKIWRVLHYENVEGFGDVKLAFDENSKLVLIHLEPKKLTAQAFLSAYSDLEFRFANEVLSPSDFKNARNTDDKPPRLGAWYVLVSVTDDVFVLGGIGNATGNVMSTMLGGGVTRQSGRSVPGDAKIIQLVSRTLENKDGTDILK